jgi:hypothetical protein
VNTKGELVGINSQIVSNSDANIGIGFAIPSNMAKHVMDDLRTKGKVTRSQLGVTVQQVTPDLASSLGLKETAGVLVSNVTPAAPRTARAEARRRDQELQRPAGARHQLAAQPRGGRGSRVRRRTRHRARRQRASRAAKLDEASPERSRSATTR